MNDVIVPTCAGCREVIDADGPDVVHAFEQVEMRTFGGTDRADGLGFYFHERCFHIAGAGFRRADE